MISSANEMAEAVQQFLWKCEHVAMSATRVVTRERVLSVTLIALVLAMFCMLVLSLSGMFRHHPFPGSGFSPPGINFYQPPPPQPVVFP
jgi:hypothetical protein